MILDKENLNGISVSSNTLLPTGVVSLDSQTVNSCDVVSNTLLPIGSIALSSILPEYQAIVLSNAPLPTSTIVLSNGSVIYSVGVKNSLTIKPINNNISIKTKF